MPINIFLCVMAMPTAYTDYDTMKHWVDMEYTFRLLFFVTLIVLGTASNMQILRKHQINYQYIFEVQPNHEATYIQVYNVGLLMAVIFNLLFMGQLMVFKFFWDFPTQTKVPTLLLTVIFLAVLMFNPVDWF